MSVLYFLEVQDPGKQDQSVPAEIIDKLAAVAKTLPHCRGLTVFTPVAGSDDPFLKDEHPPVLVIQALFDKVDDLQEGLVSTQFGALLELLATMPLTRFELVQEAMLLDPFLSSATRPGFADLSYLVNYTRPAENEAEFLQYYRQHHPAILMSFPHIRRVELGLPLDWQAAGQIRRADRLLYCEVSFDSILHLNESLNSPVRAELRRDYACFPPFTGPVTHFAMQRQVIL